MYGLNYRDLRKIIFDNLIPILKTDEIISIFAKEQSSIEGWLKVVLCNFFFEKVGKDNIKAEVSIKEFIDEDQRIDLVFTNDWAIELKTVTCAYKTRYIPKPKRRSIAALKTQIVNDIQNLREYMEVGKEKGLILFLVYPLPLTINKFEQWGHLKGEKGIEVRGNIKLEKREFKFKYGDMGALYIGKV